MRRREFHFFVDLNEPIEKTLSKVVAWFWSVEPGSLPLDEAIDEALELLVEGLNRHRARTGRVKCRVSNFRYIGGETHEG